LEAIWNEKEVVRSYTPITLDDTKGYFDLLVKTYAQGNASQYLSSLKIGDKARFRGPKGRFLYRPNMAKEVGMIAGGTGITPILQVIKAILRNPEDETKMSLIFANVSKDDILLYEELKEMALKHYDQLTVHFVLNNPPNDEEWTGSVGYITADIIKAHCPVASEDTKILMCGPPPMMTAMIKILTEELNFKPQSSPPSTDDQIQRF
jgi:cytochrome-b5 reductase